MSSARLEAEARLREKIAGREARCAVLGLGFIGSTLMDALVAAGFEAHGYDRAPSAVERFLVRSRTLGPCEGRQATAQSDPGVLREADVVIIAVRALVRADGTVDLEPLRSAADLLRASSSPGRLILVESTLPPGTTRRFAREWLGAGSDASEFIAHSPERLSAGHDWTDFRRIPHLVGGLDAPATRVAADLLGQLCDDVVSVSCPEVSELSKLLENAFISVGVGLAGEITGMALSLGISAREVCEAAATKKTGYHAFYPGPGLGGHCLPNDLMILRESGRELGFETTLIEATIRTTSRLPQLVIALLERLLDAHGTNLRGTRILLVGVGFKIGSPDTTASPAGEIVRRLRAHGALLFYMDSLVPDFLVDDAAVERVSCESLTERRFTAGIILSGDSEVEAEDLERSVDVLLDAGGGRALRGALSKAHRL